MPNAVKTQRKHQTKNIILLLFCLLIAICSVLLIWGSSIPAENVFLGFGDTESFSGGWTDPTFRGFTYERNTYTIGKGQILTFDHVLPPTIIPGSILSFRSDHLHIVASIDDNVIYESGKDDPQVFGKELGRHWVGIPLESSYAGKTLRITETNNGRASYVELYTTRIGEKGAIYAQILSTNSLLIICCIVLACIGLWLVIYSFLLRHWKVEFNHQCFLYLGLFTLVSSIWIFTDSDLLFFFTGNPSIRYMLSFFSFMLLPLTLALYYRELTKHFKKILKIVIITYFADMFVILFLYALNIVPLAKSMITINAYCIIFSAVVGVSAFIEALEYHDKAMLTAFWALLALAVPVLCDVALSFLNRSYDIFALYRIGLLVCLVILCITTFRLNMNDFKDLRFAKSYKRLAYVDETTHGNTVNKFEEVSASLFSKTPSQYFFVVYDLAHFKMVSDALGQSEGDAIIKRVYDLIASCLSANETLGYLGDAKFAVMVMAESNDSLYVRLRKIWTLLSGVDSRNLGEYSIEIHTCAVKWDDPKIAVAVMVNRAMLAFQNPHADFLEDIDCYIYNDECRKELARQQDLEKRMQTALRNKEFVVYLQPTIKLANGDICGAEALVRWIHPGEGLIAPSEFVPLFEKNGFITEIDLIIFKEVCLLINRWLSQGLTPPVMSVNISKTAIKRYEVFHRYEQIVRETGVPVKYLDFEISERVAYKDIDVVQKIIEKIHGWGATVAVDDFGCQYSNIRGLGLLQFDSIKIDRSFFSDGFPEDSRKTTLVKGVINLAGALGLSVIAQGIETQPQVEALKHLDCSFIQGYVYSPPITIQNFEQKYLPKPI